ncbi:hypothetical protein FISHEDRAFT_5758, partial [Fistulina hepatica ATCC 64428]
MSEGEILSVCHAPLDHPIRAWGLTLKRVPRPSNGGSRLLNVSSPSSKAVKRASTISVLSGLGAVDLDAPASAASSTIGSGSSSSAANQPRKLRNFFGQRPPSELITTHLTEYFPNTEKKVIRRAARNSLLMRGP